MMSDPMMNPRLTRQLAFLLEVDKLKNVIRRNFNVDDSRRENTAEHSWQIVLFAQIAFEHADHRDELDLLHIIRMLSIHDLVEIYAGDTFLFDDQANQGKYERELAAARKIFGLLPVEQAAEYLEYWLEYEAAETANAVFANAIDRILPFILNSHSQGKSWTEAGVTKTQVQDKLAIIEQASQPLWQLFNHLLDGSLEKGLLLDR